ncbi:MULTISPECIES: flagellar biosynthesis protein FlhA [Caloramator]|uniref:Flagellar biosynthesis protein FlhA n=1 Tax=Caloramator proteoclasticus DSM 10124 TaxID=1121262 RepID=A0A1M4SSR2_9CLOT|nr:MULTISPECIES: flagellar biosynthesis protein FlhA [Caloramator]SHE35215.1 flagellar biosynthesis protein FlhA [Caloramator proteoclasticus DSM 10124]
MDFNKNNNIIKKYLDVIVSLLVVLIIFMIIIPLPPTVLDILLAANLTFSLIILLLTMFTTDVLEFSAFPTILLVTTLFRLGLNISSTRLILGRGEAGKIIEAFGNFVVGGNYVVGFILFIIIIVIQFVVITNGAGRVAEVSARFTLDAMPGKQMSIDADLNAGIITEQEAKIRRKKLQQEADFYGAMDGASKFVKGDAIAGIVITIINLIGGVIIGMIFLGLPALEALKHFALLTVGDGLVSQIPALLISTASGIIVTRTSSDVSLGKELSTQFTSYPKVLAIASFIMFLMAWIPNLPAPAFLIMSGATGFSAYLLSKEKKNQEILSEVATSEIQASPTREPENVLHLLNVEPLEIEIGYGLIPLADISSGGDLLDRIAGVRRQCAVELGIIVQPIRIRDNLQLATNEYRIKIKGTIVGKGEILCNHFLAIDASGEGLPIDGIKTIEPAFGLPAVWIPDNKKDEAEIMGITVIDPTTVLVTHLSEIIKKHSYELLGRQEVKLLIDNIKESYPAVVEELIPNLMSLGELQKVLQNLLRELVPIRDLVTILETLADNAVLTKDTELLTEYVRIALSRTICRNLIDEQGVIRVITLDINLENMISENIHKSLQGSYPALEPNITTQIYHSIKDNIELNQFNNDIPVILVNPKIRPAFRRMIEMVFPQVQVLSMNEIPTDIQIETIGMVTLQ